MVGSWRVARTVSDLRIGTIHSPRDQAVQLTIIRPTDLQAAAQVSLDAIRNLELRRKAVDFPGL